MVLHGGKVVLRGMTPADMPLVRKWWNDPQVSFFSDDNPPHDYTDAEIDNIYTTLAKNAIVFIIEHGGEPVGDCWLQRMNIDRVLEEFPGKDIRRIDLSIGERQLWGRGLGTETIGLLAGLAFGPESADLIFEAEIGNHNPRSLQAFQKCGFTVHAKRGPWHDGRASASYDLILTREKWESRQSTPA